MRTLKLGAVLFLTNIFLIAQISFAADVAKIGIVDLQKVLETSSPGKSAQAQIKEKKDNMEQDLNQKGAELEKLRERLERESMVMSKETREEKEREIRIKLNDFKSLQKKYRTELQDLEKKLVTELQDDVFTLVGEIGKKQGYLLIISKIGVLYSPNSIDLTDKLIQQLNDKYAKKASN